MNACRKATNSSSRLIAALASTTGTAMPRPSPALIEPADTRSAAPESRAEESESSQRLAAAIETLSPPVRQVVVMHYTGGLSLRQTAAAMGLSLGTVKSRINRARLEPLRK